MKNKGNNWLNMKMYGNNWWKVAYVGVLLHLQIVCVYAYVIIFVHFRPCRDVLVGAEFC